jgi:SAM-dependent methyltransferase
MIDSTERISHLQFLLNKELRSEVYGNFQRAFQGIIYGPEHLDRMTDDSLNLQRAREQLVMLENSTEATVRGKKILEVGCGHGLTVVLARLEFGSEAYGIEPGQEEFSGAYAINQRVLSLSGLAGEIISSSVGEAIPFPNHFFDFVFSSNVLEHVIDPQKVINESLRVLKPGGYLHFIVPNYGSWWEGHYGILWVPNLPRFLARFYVRLYRRTPDFLDTLQFINRSKLERLLQPHIGYIEIVGWGENIWKERMQTMNVSEYAALTRLKHLLRIVHKMKLVSLVVWVGTKLHWETPIILTLRKI